MYTRILLWSLFLFLAEIGNLYAQPPNPPAGWEYVRGLDSLTIDEFHAVGDTIFMFGFDNHVSLKRSFKVVSYDGGNSWDSVVIPLEITESYRYGVFPTEAKIWMSHIIDERRRFYISKDGKNYEWLEIGKDTTAGLGFSNFFIDPKDPNHWIIIGSFKLGLSKNSRLSQSFDAGRNWKVVNVPTAPAEQLTMELVFDARREGVWYVRVTAEPHVGQGTVLIERTTNNGETFQEVQQWGLYAGIRSFGEMRKWVITKPEYYTIDGLMKSIDTLSQRDTVNWLSEFHPDFPYSNYSNGYYRTLSQYQSQQFSPESDYPTNFHFLLSDPLNQSVVEYEAQWDVQTNVPYSFQSWIYHTEDDWVSKKVIWPGERNVWAQKTFLDQSQNILYAIVSLTEDSLTSNPRFFKSWLYRYQLKKTIVSNIQNQTTLSSYPQPSKGYLSIGLPKTIENTISLTLFTVEGRSLYSTTNNFYFSQGILEWSIPEHLATGLYFLKIKTNDSTYLVKVILQR